MLNILKLIFGGLAARPLITAGGAAALDYAFNKGQATSGVVNSLLSPLFSGVTNFGQDAVSSIGKMFTDGTFTKWFSEHKELAIGGAILASLLGVFGAQGRSLGMWAAAGFGLYLAYKGGLLSSFATAAKNAISPHAAPTASVGQPTTFALPFAELALEQ